MLNEVQIEKYLYRYAERHENFVKDIGNIIAVRLESNSRVRSLDKAFSLGEALKREQDLNKIKRTINNLIQTQTEELGKDLAEISRVIYNDSKSDIGDGENYYLPKTVKNAIEQAKLSLLTLINNPTFISNGKIYLPADLYTTVIQQGLLTKGVFASIGPLRNALERFLNARSTFTYKDTTDTEPRTVSAINSLRMNVLNSIKNIIEKTKNFIVSKFKSDGVELSAHIAPAPDHAPAQGHQFSNEEFAKMQSGSDFVDVQGRSYQGFQRPIFAWNCRHYTKPIKIGKSKQEHTDEELQKILDDNERGYTTSDGRHYTLYECTQIQRGYERKIRDAKAKWGLYNTIKDNTKTNEYLGKINSLVNQYKTFSNACGLPVHNDRIKS